MTHGRPARLTVGDKAQLTAILVQSPELAALHEHIAVFTGLMTKRRGLHLEQGITTATANAPSGAAASPACAVTKTL